MGTRKTKQVKRGIPKKDLKNIDNLFADLEKDTSLPTFGEFFIMCVMFGIEEKVNLRKMYPKLYKSLHKKLLAISFLD